VRRIALVLLRDGAAVSGSARRRVVNEAQAHFERAAGVCALAPVTRTLLRWLWTLAPGGNGIGAAGAGLKALVNYKQRQLTLSAP